MFTAALFTIGKIRKQPKCLSTDEWIKEMWYTHTNTHTQPKKERHSDICDKMDGYRGYYP